MNTDAYFAKIDASDALRFDLHEGADEAWQFKEISIRDDTGNWVPIGGAQSPLIYRYGNKESRNILCMYMLTDRENFQFDEKNIDFGDSAVVITDLKEFVRRFQASAKAAGKRLLQGPVEYVDKKDHHGQMGPFRKFSDYDYQREFRFVLFGANGKSQEPIKFSIGSIRDISLVCPSGQLSKFLKAKC